MLGFYRLIVLYLSLIHISEPTRRTPISYAVFCLKKPRALRPPRSPPSGRTHTHLTQGFFQAEDGIRDRSPSRGLGDVYKRQVQDTLPKFLKEHDPKINFVHMDLDTYDSSKYVLSKIKPYLVENAVILFDELYNFPGWEVGEYKALTEVFNEDEYKFLAFAKSEKNAAIKIIKKSNK